MENKSSYSADEVERMLENYSKGIELYYLSQQSREGRVFLAAPSENLRNSLEKLSGIPTNVRSGALNNLLHRIKEGVGRHG